MNKSNDKKNTKENEEKKKLLLNLEGIQTRKTIMEISVDVPQKMKSKIIIQIRYIPPRLVPRQLYRTT